MLLERLCQIGLTLSEAKVYLGLLRIGSQAVSVIAKNASLNRTTTYSILKSLEKKGFVSSYVSGNVKYFSANDPNCLVAYVDKKCRTFDYYRNEILALVPNFRKLCGGFDLHKPVVSFFEGFSGVRYIMQDVLDAGRDYVEFLPMHKWLEDDLKDFSLKFSRDRLERNIKIQAIVPDRAEVRDFFQDNYNLADGKTLLNFICDEDFTNNFNSQMMIYGDKVANIYLDHDNRYGILIESPQIAATMRGTFEILWKWFSKTG